MGGLVKRWITLLAKIRDKRWYEVVAEVESNWNKNYISWFGVGPPNAITWENFDTVVEAMYERHPLYMQSLYPFTKILSEREARSIFKFQPGDSVLVSLKALSKIIRNPVSPLLDSRNLRLERAD